MWWEHLTFAVQTLFTLYTIWCVFSNFSPLHNAFVSLSGYCLTFIRLFFILFSESMVWFRFFVRLCESLKKPCWLNGCFLKTFIWLPSSIRCRIKNNFSSIFSVEYKDIWIELVWRLAKHPQNYLYSQTTYLVFFYLCFALVLRFWCIFLCSVLSPWFLLFIHLAINFCFLLS